MFWCRVKSYHAITSRGIDKQEARDETVYDKTLIRLTNVWESSLKRVYDMVKTPYERGAFIVLEVEERGPRGVVYAEPLRHIGLFDAKARAGLIDRPSSSSVWSVRPAGVTVLGYEYCETYNAGWYLPTGALTAMTDAPGSNDVGKLIAAGNALWNKAAHKTQD